MTKDGDRVWEGWVAVDPDGQIVNWSLNQQEFLVGQGWRAARVRVLLPQSLFPECHNLIADPVRKDKP